MVDARGTSERLATLEEEVERLLAAVREIPSRG